MAKYLELSAKVTVKSDGKMGENSLFNFPIQPKQEKTDDKKNVNKNTEFNRNHI